MPRRWRKALGLSLALLFAAAAIIAARLDAGRLAASVQTQLPAWAARATHGGQPDFSLMQGLSLSLRDVDIRARNNQWRLHADRVRLSLSFWGVLHGRADIRAVDIVHPTFHLSPRTTPPAISPDALPESWDRLRIRQGEIHAEQRKILWSLDATIRHTHARREITWEAQALTDGGSLTLQGRIRRQQDGRHDLFGSLKIKGAHLASLPRAWRRGWPDALTREALDASLTFDMDADKRWSLFGDMRLRDVGSAESGRPELRWRGKVEGVALKRLAWRDTYLRVGKAAFATHGACSSSPAPRPFSDCRFEFNARNANIRPLAALADADIDINGRLDVTARGTWRGGIWHLSGKGKLRDASWNSVELPDTRLELADAQWRGGHDRVSLRGLRITPGAEGGSLLLTHVSAGIPAGDNRHSGQTLAPARNWRVEARLERLRDAWVAWGNALLGQFDRPATLQGQGMLDGDIHADFRNGRLRATCRLDATQARIAWDRNMAKPDGVRARLRGRLEHEKDAMLLRLELLELGTSHLANSEWRWRQGRLTDVAATDVRLAPDELHRQGVALPETLRGWHGTLTGALTGVHPSGTADIEPAWFGAASGQLSLASFGKTRRVSGQLQLTRGRLRARGIRWRKADSEDANTLELDADVRLPATAEQHIRGRVDIHHATLDWHAGDAWPAWLAGAELRGGVRDARVRWMENDWKVLRARYRLRAGLLELSRLRGALAGGSVQSPKLTLRPSSTGVRFDGLIRMGAVRLGRVQGLDTALGAKLDGYLYLNARLRGALPWTAATWGGNGDVEIQRGRWQATDTRIHLAAGEEILATNTVQRFSRLTARFRFAARASTRARLMLPRLQVELGAAGRQGVLAGRAALYAGGVLSGTAHIRRDGTAQRVSLSGVWPELDTLFAPQKPNGENARAP